MMSVDFFFLRLKLFFFKLVLKKKKKSINENCNSKFNLYFSIIYLIDKIVMSFIEYFFSYTGCNMYI